jgi:hypothetical protein
MGNAADMETKHGIVLSIAVFLIGGLAGTQLGSVTATSAQQTLDTYPVDLSLAGQHRHDRLTLAPEDAPSLNISVTPGTMMTTHFNVHIMTENFAFAPGKVGSSHVFGEGHAHVFVDDVKISRAYGPWYHLPRLDPGTHTIRVTLNTNDHREYAVNGETIAATQTVTVAEDAQMNMSMDMNNQ